MITVIVKLSAQYLIRTVNVMRRNNA